MATEDGSLKSLQPRSKAIPPEGELLRPASDSPREKREQILQGAMQVFLTDGYAGTSMDRAAAAAGVSKQTLYSHFQDKDGLFMALIERVTLERTRLDDSLDHLKGDPETMLRQVAALYLAKMADQEYLALLRVIIAESARFPELAQLYTRTVIQKVHIALTHYFRSHPELGIPDPEATARIFWGTLVAFLMAQELLDGKSIMPLDAERLIDSLITLLLASRSTVESIPAGAM